MKAFFGKNLWFARGIERAEPSIDTQHSIATNVIRQKKAL